MLSHELNDNWLTVKQTMDYMKLGRSKFYAILNQDAGRVIKSLVLKNGKGGNGSNKGKRLINRESIDTYLVSLYGNN